MDFEFEEEEYAQNTTQKQNRVVKEFIKPPKPKKPSKPLNEKRLVYLLSKKERQKSPPCIVNVTSRSEEVTLERSKSNHLEMEYWIESILSWTWFQYFQY